MGEKTLFGCKKRWLGAKNSTPTHSVTQGAHLQPPQRLGTPRGVSAAMQHDLGRSQNRMPPRNHVALDRQQHRVPLTCTHSLEFSLPNGLYYARRTVQCAPTGTVPQLRQGIVTPRKDESTGCKRDGVFVCCGEAGDMVLEACDVSRGQD